MNKRAKAMLRAMEDGLLVRVYISDQRTGGESSFGNYFWSRKREQRTRFADAFLQASRELRRMHKRKPSPAC